MFDVFLDYSAKTDSMMFYWSIPGVDQLFQIGQPITLSQALGSSVPRIMKPYMVGYMFNGAAVPSRWNVTVDDFVAYREDAP